MWSGDSLHRDRVSTEGASAKSPFLGGVWAIQPVYIKELFQNPFLIHGGFLARCMIFNTHARKVRMKEEKVDTDFEEWNDLVGSLLRLRKGDEVETGDQSSIYFVPAISEVKSSSGATRVFATWSGYCADLAEDCDELTSLDMFPSRWAEQAVKFALSFHQAENKDDPSEVEVSRETAINAVMLTQWVARQQMD